MASLASVPVVAPRKKCRFDPGWEATEEEEEVLEDGPSTKAERIFVVEECETPVTIGLPVRQCTVPPPPDSTTEAPVLPPAPQECEFFFPRLPAGVRAIPSGPPQMSRQDLEPTDGQLPDLEEEVQPVCVMPTSPRPRALLATLKDQGVEPPTVHARMIGAPSLPAIMESTASDFTLYELPPAPPWASLETAPLPPSLSEGAPPPTGRWQRGRELPSAASLDSRPADRGDVTIDAGHVLSNGGETAATSTSIVSATSSAGRAHFDYLNRVSMFSDMSGRAGESGGPVAATASNSQGRVTHVRSSLSSNLSLGTLATTPDRLGMATKDPTRSRSNSSLPGSLLRLQSSFQTMSSRITEPMSQSGTPLGRVSPARAFHRLCRLDTCPVGEDQELFAELATFEQCEELLRASRFSSVMSARARIFQSSAGSAETYSMSEAVSGIDVFISHNWAVTRAKKFYCLALHFNALPALLFAMITVPLLALAKFYRALPHDSCLLAVAPIIFLILCFGDRFRWLVGSDPRVFLDKTCIHQVDWELQQRGIRKLGAFLRMSSHMAIIYTDLYLTKLWTVYEVGCFLSLCSEAQMTVIPTFLPAVVVLGIAFLYVVELGLAILFEFDVDHERKWIREDYRGLGSSAVIICIMMILLAKFFRYLAHKVEDIHDKMSLFSIDACNCACEDDRPIVYGNICLLMRATGAVSVDATDEEARDVFNGIMRERLPNALTASIGRVGLRYSHVIMSFCCTFLPSRIAAYTEDTTRGIVASVLHDLTWTFAIFPLLVALMSSWCKFNLYLRGWSEVGFLALGVLWQACVAIAVLFALGQLSSAAQHSSPAGNLCLASMVFILLSSVLLAIGVYNRGGAEDRDPLERKKTRTAHSAARDSESSTTDDCMIVSGPMTAPAIVIERQVS